MALREVPEAIARPAEIRKFAPRSSFSLASSSRWPLIYSSVFCPSSFDGRCANISRKYWSCRSPAWLSSFCPSTYCGPKENFPAASIACSGVLPAVAPSGISVLIPATGGVGAAGAVGAPVLGAPKDLLGAAFCAANAALICAVVGILSAPCPGVIGSTLPGSSAEGRTLPASRSATNCCIPGRANKSFSAFLRVISSIASAAVPSVG